jgi:TRAP transporter TAXI family solute receptor
MMLRNLLVKVVMVMFCSIALTIGQSPLELQAAVKYISFGTGDPGGTYYFLGASFAQMINKSVPGVRVIAESTQAGTENFNYIIRKRLNIGLSDAGVIMPAVEKKQDISGLRLIGMGHTNVRHWFVRKESPIKSLADFRGRRIAVGSPGSGTLNNTRTELIGTGTLSWEDIKPAYLSFSESVNAIKDENVDVGTIAAGVPIASILDLSRQVPIRLISYNDKEMNTLIAKYPYFVKGVIRAGTYTGIDADVVCRGMSVILFCHKDTEDDLVYKIARTIYEPSKEKDAVHPQAGEWNLTNIFRGADYVTKYIPFHSGTIKYLKEKQVWK